MDEYPVVHFPEDQILEEEEFEKLYTASDQIVVLLSIFYGSISILAVVGNTLVIWVVATTRQMRTVTNMYIANLAFADVIIGLFCIPFQFQAALLQRWNLPWFMCGFCPFVQALSVNVSVFTLTAIAIDRHRAIINPLRARPTKFISKIIIGTIWLVAFTFAIPCAIAFRVEMVHERIREGDVIYNMSRPFCLNKNLSDDQLQTYRYSLVFVQYLVPFCVISFVYIQMAIKLWGTQTPGNAQDTRDITLLRNKKKVIKMLIIVVIVFGLCWLPLQLYNILYVTIPEINEYHFISIIWFCCDWLAMSNSCYNPFIYGIYNEKFKREFNKRFAACFCRFQTTLDQQDRNMSMHTRASSIRSTYANTSMRIRNNTKHFSLNNYTLNTALAGTPSALSNYHLAQQRHSAGMAVRTLKGAGNNGCAVYNTITCMENVSGRSGNMTGIDSTLLRDSCQWRRNNFKPLYPDVIEHEDDLALMNVHSSSSAASGDLSPNTTTATRNATDVKTVAMSNGKGGKTGKSVTCTNATNRANCICEKELGSRTACDGTCILNEVSRVHAPALNSPADGAAITMTAVANVAPDATAITTKLPTTTSMPIAIAIEKEATITTATTAIPITTTTTTTTTPTTSMAMNIECSRHSKHCRTVDFNVSNEANMLIDVDAVSEYTPLTTITSFHP